MTRTRLKILLWAGVPWLAIACQETPHITEPFATAAADTAVQTLALPALDATLAAELSIGLEDALTRLAPADAQALRFELASLRTLLFAADTETLRGALDTSRRALEALDMPAADADALFLTLINVEQALTPVTH